MSYPRPSIPLVVTDTDLSLIYSLFDQSAEALMDSKYLGMGLRNSHVNRAQYRATITESGITSNKSITMIHLIGTFCRSRPRILQALTLWQAQVIGEGWHGDAVNFFTNYVVDYVSTLNSVKKVPIQWIATADPAYSSFLYMIVMSKHYIKAKDWDWNDQTKTPTDANVNLVCKEILGQMLEEFWVAQHNLDAAMQDRQKTAEKAVWDNRIRSTRSAIPDWERRFKGFQEKYYETKANDHYGFIFWEDKRANPNKLIDWSDSATVQITEAKFLAYIKLFFRH